MLTRHEILSELRRIGIKEPSVLKTYLKDFEHYMEINHGSEFDNRNGALLGLPALDTPSATEFIDRYKNSVIRVMILFPMKGES